MTLVEFDGQPGLVGRDLTVLDPGDGTERPTTTLDREVERGVVVNGGDVVVLFDEGPRRLPIDR